MAEVVELDMQLEDGKVVAYRAKVKVSFKYESSAKAPATKATTKAPAKTATARRR